MELIILTQICLLSFYRPWQPDAAHSSWQAGDHLLCAHRGPFDADVFVELGSAAR